MTDKDKNKLEEAISETKGIAEQFVQTLGLTDLILGGLALYVVRLLYGSDITILFVSTGHAWIDIALLACGSALTGKVILLLAYVGAGIVENIIESRNLLDASSTLEEALKPHRETNSSLIDTSKWEKVDIATTFAIKANPNLKQELERNRTGTVISYSAALLAIPFALYIIIAGARWGLILILVLSVLALIILALVNQIDYLITIRNNLTVFLPAKKGLLHTIKEEERMKISISTNKRLKARQASQLLAALVILRDALAIESDKEADEALERLNGISDPDRRADIEIMRIGKVLLFNDKEAFLDDRLYNLVVQAFVQRTQDENDLELVSISEGSAIGVIKEGIKRISEKIWKGLSASAGLLPNRDREAFNRTVAAMIQDENMSGRAKTIAAGQAMVGAELLSRTLKEMQASNISVKRGIEDEE
jgi:hypothetical protein